MDKTNKHTKRTRKRQLTARAHNTIGYRQLCQGPVNPVCTAGTVPVVRRTVVTSAKRSSSFACCQRKGLLRIPKISWMRRRGGFHTIQQLWQKRAEDRPCDIRMDYEIGPSNNPAHSEAPSYIIIFESELRTLAGVTALSPELEVSGEGFGPQTQAGNPVIYLVSGSGSNSIREPAYCRQDFHFFRRVSEILSVSYALQPSGTFHSHRSLGGLTGPSGFDIEQVRRIAARNNLNRWYQIVTSYVEDGDTRVPHDRHTDNTGWWGDCPQVRVRAFLYTDPRAGLKTEVRLRVLPGVSPFRTIGLASGKLAPDDIAEYASGFPMYKIIFESHDRREASSVGKLGTFEKMAQQFQELPEQIQDGIELDVEGDFAIITLPVSEHRSLRIAYSGDRTNEIQAVFLYDDSTAQPRDLTQNLLHGRRDLTLKNLYESLLCREAGVQSPLPFHATQRYVSGRASGTPEELTPKTELRRNTDGKSRMQ
jgi:hypothetical protein